MEEPCNKCKALSFEHKREDIPSGDLHERCYLGIIHWDRRDRKEQCINCWLIKETKWEEKIIYLTPNN